MIDHAQRSERVRSRFDEFDIDALLVTNLTNVRYLTGFSGTNGQCLVTRWTSWFFTDPRYEARAGSLVRGAEVQVYPQRLSEVLVPRLRDAAAKRLGIEASSVTLAERDGLRDAVREVDLVPVDGAIEDLRRVKDADEIDAIRRAVQVADDAFVWVLDRLAPGETEREVSLDLEVKMRLSGADEVSFPPIVGSGPLSAHIHHSPSDRAFEKGDLILLDFGCRVDGYCSDMTRTVVLGPATEAQRERYSTVLEAQLAGIDAVEPGRPGSKVDAVARGVVEHAGLGDRFPHSLGHGIGLGIHETPALRTSQEPLLAGEVVTIEPGVYVPDDGGIRIEDVVVVRDGGAEVVTTSAKDSLIEL